MLARTTVESASRPVDCLSVETLLFYGFHVMGPKANISGLFTSTWTKYWTAFMHDVLTNLANVCFLNSCSLQEHFLWAYKTPNSREVFHNTEIYSKCKQN